MKFFQFLNSNNSGSDKKSAEARYRALARVGYVSRQGIARARPFSFVAMTKEIASAAMSRLHKVNNH